MYSPLSHEPGQTFGGEEEKTLKALTLHRLGDPTPTLEPKPEATLEAKPEATLEAKPEATLEATPEATLEATPEATLEPDYKPKPKF